VCLEPGSTGAGSGQEKQQPSLATLQLAAVQTATAYPAPDLALASAVDEATATHDGGVRQAQQEKRQVTLLGECCTMVWAVSPVQMAKVAERHTNLGSGLHLASQVLQAMDAERCAQLMAGVLRTEHALLVESCLAEPVAYSKHQILAAHPFLTASRLLMCRGC